MGELELTPDRFTVELVNGVSEHRGELDEQIDALTPDWPLERMPKLDLAVLRLGAFELIHRSSTPVAVVIDEAVELAKRFSTEDSSSFVNGVLDRLAKGLQSPEP